MNVQEDVQTNRQFKDRLFRLIFGSEKNKVYILDLYNALNGTDYSDVNMFELTTIQDVVYMGMKNDTSFIIDSELNLFEQQSTYNPNMPFREFEYCAKLLDKWVKENNLDIYGSTLIKLPTPKCYVFYNGTEEHADKEILKLSDAFITLTEGCEWTVTMLNINIGHNLELMNKCGILREYSEFVAMVRDNTKKLSSMFPSEEAAKQSIEQTVVAFIERNGLLSGFLKSHRAEVVDVCITEYDEVLHLETVRNEGRAEGLAPLFSFIADGTITLEDAVKRTDMSVEEFRKMYDASPYASVNNRRKGR